jgi:hypothetical protein
MLRPICGKFLKLNLKTYNQLSKKKVILITKIHLNLYKNCLI